MDENLIRLDARLGALELLVRNLYAHRFAGQADPLGAAEQAVSDVERLGKRIEVKGKEPAMNDLLAAEAEEFLVAMFREIVEIIQEIKTPAQSLEIHTARRPVQSRETPECPTFPRHSPKLRRAG